MFFAFARLLCTGKQTRTHSYEIEIQWLIDYINNVLPNKVNRLDIQMS